MEKDPHSRIDGPSKSPVFAISTKTARGIVIQGYAEFLGGFKGVSEIDGYCCVQR